MPPTANQEAPYLTASAARTIEEGGQITQITPNRLQGLLFRVAQPLQLQSLLLQIALRLRRRRYHGGRLFILNLLTLNPSTLLLPP